MNEPTPSEQIDNIIQQHSGWKGAVVKDIRTAVLAANSQIIEEVKWKMKTRPEGLAVWSHNGIVCFVEIWKDNVKVLFPNGALLPDPTELFNARLQSATIRAYEIHEGDALKLSALKNLVNAVIDLNAKK